MSTDRKEGRMDGAKEKDSGSVATSLWWPLLNGLTLHSHPSGEWFRVTAAAAISSSGVSFKSLQHKSIWDNQTREPGGFFQQLPERSGGPMGQTSPMDPGRVLQRSQFSG